MRRSGRAGLVVLLLALGCGPDAAEPQAGGARLGHWAREARLVSFFSFWNSDKDERRREAFRRLVEIGEPAVPVLLELLDAGDPVSGNALNALCQLGPRAVEAIPALLGALAEADAERRGDAATALGCIGPPAEAAVPSLVKLLAEAEGPLRERPAQALAKLGEPGRRALERAARDADPRVRAAAVGALGSDPRGSAATPPAPALLASAFHDPAPEVRARAFGLVRPRSSQDVEALLEALLRGMADPSTAVREAARRWYHGPAQPHLTPPLLARVLVGGDPESRRDAAWKLGSPLVESPPARRAPLEPAVAAALEAALDDEDPTVRIYAVRALSGDTGRRARLVAVLRDALAAPELEAFPTVTGAPLLYALGGEPVDVAAAYTRVLRSDDFFAKRTAFGAIREMGRAAESLRPELERLRADPDLRVREYAGWLLTELADRSR